MSVKKIMLYDETGNIIFEDRIASLPVKEDSIIKKSIELFSENEPCVIQRTMAVKSCYIEMDEYFTSMQQQGTLVVKNDELPAWITDMLDISQQIQKFVIV
ncbi:MAG TPA: hypothetical protein VHT34_03910 [Clostridia bacterium]|nr:hypothetical protein [Clostridia bacterium]